MNKNLYYALVVGAAGFLFGFDTVVISGANLPLKNLWQLSNINHGTFIMSMALWGTVVGALFAGYPTNRLGRKTTLMWIGVFYSVSALGSALANDPYIFSIFRFIGGLGVGASSIAAPVYISEISSAKNRGRLGTIYQFNIVLGVLVAFISNYFLEGFGGENDWRWMLGIECLPAIVYTLLILGVPESPRWLLLYRGKREQALKILKFTVSEEESKAILKSVHEDSGNETVKSESLLNGKHNKALWITFLIAFFNQLSGINFILYYAPEILEKAGYASSESLLSSISVGIVNLIFTLLGMYLIDRVGRKKLMYIGSIGYIISLGMVSFAFYTDAPALFKLIFILTFIASHAVGQGAVIWVFISEMFPNSVRAFGQSWGCGVHWVMAALITLTGSVLIASVEPYFIFLIFAFFMLLQLLFTHYLMPETKNKALEEI